MAVQMMEVEQILKIEIDSESDVEAFFPTRYRKNRNRVHVQ